MANTLTSAKRARQAEKRKERNTIVRSSTRTAIRGAMDALKNAADAQAKDAYNAAVKALSKAASKGAIPKGRASRKISRLTLLAKKIKPGAVQSPKLTK
ncbi:MAG: 30S ribosomal protein S20 [Methylotenera sp.]|nr:30S ribosomal protein S20 [Oligoflexia bacterium]